MLPLNRSEYLQAKHVENALIEVDEEIDATIYPSSKVTALFFLTVIAAKEALEQSQDYTFCSSKFCQYSFAFGISAFCLTLVLSSHISKFADGVFHSRRLLWNTRDLLDKFQASDFLSEKDLEQMEISGHPAVFQKLKKYPVCPEDQLKNFKEKEVLDSA